MKLTDKDIKEIAKMIDKNVSPIEIALKFNHNLSNIKQIIRRYKIHGLNGIMHPIKSKEFTPELKLKIIERFYSGESKCSLAAEINVGCSLITLWIKKYEQLGYNGLVDSRGRSKLTVMTRLKKQEEKQNEKYAPLDDNERAELNELRIKTRRLEMELEVTKKLQTLVQERVKRQTPKK